MKDELNKKELKKERVVEYKTPNPNVVMAEIILYEYRGKTLHQPRLINSNNRLINSRCAYYDIDDAKMCIDRYSDDSIHNLK